MRGRHWTVVALATVLAFGVSACGGDEGAEDTGRTQTPQATQPSGAQGQQQALPVPEGATQEQVDQGRQLFTGQGACHACHGPQATGTMLAPDLTDGEWINVSGPDLEEVAQLIRTGVPDPVEHPGPMPPMGGANLNDAQIQALAAYIVALNQS